MARQTDASELYIYLAGIIVLESIDSRMVGGGRSYPRIGGISKSI